MVCAQDDPLDEYTAFCFDEVCAYILSLIEQGEEPIFMVDEQPAPKHFSCYSEMLEYFEITNRG